ncbi:DUF3238 domain-containing protein [Paenibacillus sp. Soil787]|uniref:DUF3238 domain-containing protein n=1 Tax=Paenibacillus sp. Soil787 TaxID=1736411 RepID=UPI00070269D2|nr:DUF3238 domain-containing protein [Paenibacillus sp. Soil787]KRF28664.1 hypothetical protein ASG93_28710 [Paenibacillus sp. Soil787]
MNLDDNTVVGFNYVTVTERIDKDNNVIKAKRDTNKNMYMANFNQPGVTDSITLGAGAVVSNELSFGAPSIDYSATIKIKNKSEIESSITLDKFPSYEGYVSINGGDFNPLYQKEAIPFESPILKDNPKVNNPFFNLAFSRGTFTNNFTYDKDFVLDNP